MKGLRRFNAALLAVLISIAMMAGCSGAKTPDQAATGSGTTAQTDTSAAADTGSQEAGSPDNGLSERVSITLGWMYLGDSASIPGWPDENFPAMAIQDKFNVDFTLVNYDPEKMSIDLAAGTLPDIVEVLPDQVDAILRGKHALALDPYLDTLAQNINQFSFRNEMMRKFKSNGDGNLYFRTPYVGRENALNGVVQNTGFRVRWNLYKEIGLPEMRTYEDYMNVLLQMQEIYPQTEDGLPVYATGIHNSQGLDRWLDVGRDLLGKQPVSTVSGSLYTRDNITNEIESDVYTDKDESAFWLSMEWHNKFYNNGLLDPDSFIMKQEDMEAKRDKGQYLAFQGADSNTSSENYDPMQRDVILPDKFGTYNMEFQIGWSDKLYFVNVNGPNIERSIMVMDYMDSEEFARIVFSGVEGIHWEYGADGTPALKPETIAFAGDPTRAEAWEATHINYWRYHCMVGMSAFSVLSDGAFASLWEDPDIYEQRLLPHEKDFCETYDLKYPGEMHYNLVQTDPENYKDGSNILWDIVACLPVIPAEINRIDKACEELIYNTVPALVTAKSESDFAAIRATLIQQMKDLNIEESIAWWTANWNESKAYVESQMK